MRQIKRTRYIVAGILTFLLFSFGILLGFFFENIRMSKLYDELKVKKIEFSDLQLQNRYIAFLEDQGSCDELFRLFYKSMTDLDDKRIKMEEYFKMAKIKKEEYSMLKHEYTIAIIDYWMLSELIKKRCNARFSTILYFYGTKAQCPKCEDQGTHLTYIKKLLKDNVLIFPIDSNIPGTVQLLKQTYNIESYPTVIINGKKYGYLTNKEILKILCKYQNYTACTKLKEWE